MPSSILIQQLRNHPDTKKIMPKYFDIYHQNEDSLCSWLRGMAQKCTWLSTNTYLPNTPPGTSLFGVTPIEQVQNCPQATTKLQTSSEFIALRQGSDIAYRPVDGESENKLFVEPLLEAIRGGNSLSSSRTFVEMVIKRNEKARGNINGIYKKTIAHLARRNKRWWKNRSKKEAINNDKCRALLKDVEHVATIETPFDDLYQEAWTQIQPAGTPFPQLGREIVPIIQQQLVGKQKRKLCTNPKCTYAFCEGPFGSVCTKNIEDGIISTKAKQKTKTTFVCKYALCRNSTCPGKNDHSRCTRSADDE